MTSCSFNLALIRREALTRWPLLLVVAFFGAAGCGIPDRSPADTVKAYEDNVSSGNAREARSLLTVQRAKEADALFADVSAEERNRRDEGVVTEMRFSKTTTGESAQVLAVFAMKDGIRRTYTWQLLREQRRWRINSWEVEASGEPTHHSLNSPVSAQRRNGCRFELNDALAGLAT